MAKAVKFEGDEDVPAKAQETIAGIPIGKVDKTGTYFNILIYAEPGTGKTVLAGSASAVKAMAPILVVDIEGGTLSLDDFYPDVDVVRVKTWDQLQKVYNELYSGKTKYKTVIIDSLTEAQKFSMSTIMRAAHAEKPDVVDPDVPRQRDWGKSIEQIRRLVRGFRDLQMNVIFTALAVTNKDEKTGRVTTRPSLPGKLSSEVSGFVDIVAYMYVKIRGEEMKRLLLTQKTDSVVAKDRSNKLPKIVEDPTMQLLYSAIIGDSAGTSAAKSA